MKRPKKSSSKVSKLPSASLPPAHLSEVGARFPVANLLAQAERVLPKINAPGFAQFGFGPAWSGQIRSLMAELEARVSAKDELKSEAVPTAAPLLAAIADAKAWRRTASTVASLLPGSTHAPAGTGSSVAKLVASIKALSPIVGSKAATAHGGGPAMKAAGAKVLATLSAASKARLAATGKVSPGVRAVNLNAGILYEELRRLARAARTVVPGEAKLFAVSTHVHGHQPSKKRAKTAAPPASGSSSSPPTTSAPAATYEG